MKKYEKLKAIFNNYNCYSFKVKNSDYSMTIKTGERFKEKHLNYCKKYISIVDEAISKLDKYEQQLIHHIYIKKLPREELPYSSATFYNKRNKALEKLNKLLVTTNITQFIS